MKTRFVWGVIVMLMVAAFAMLMVCSGPEKPGTVTMTGVIRNDMIAAGGEMTEFVLYREHEGYHLLNHKSISDMEKYVGKRVKVTGIIDYLERGSQPILEISKISYIAFFIERNTKWILLSMLMAVVIVIIVKNLLQSRSTAMPPA